jgi:peptidyl-prolyl cis-trans isomerase D
MLGFVRNMMKSKWGVVVTLGFVALIALAFAGGDIANTGSFGGVAGGDRVAVVGGERVDTGELNTAARNAFDRARAQNPTLTMQAFINADTLGRVLDDLVGRVGISEFAQRYGLRAGKRLVDSEIVQIPQFRDAQGNFDSEAFVALLKQRGLSESQVREDFAQGLLARQLLTPVELGATMPASVAKRYVSLLRESRTGTIAILPSSAYAPAGAPSAAQLQAYYTSHSAAYIRPERRVLRYATFNDGVIASLPAPTDAQIKAYYGANAVRYAASERRSFTQLVVPTQQAAEAIRKEIAGGTSLDQAAREKGLATAKVPALDRTQLTNQASAAVAQAGFGAAQGALTAPARGGLGWYLLRVDAIDRTPARTLAAARGEIVTTLAAQQKRDALNTVTVAIEDELDGGASLAEVAQKHGLTLTDTPPITADGKVYGTTGTLPAALQPVLTTAFAMEEQEPQLAQVIPGEAFAIYEAAEIVPSAAAPLAEIRAAVEADWRKAQGDAAAKIAADRVLKRLQGGATLAAALAAENRTLPPPDRIAMKREQLTQIASQGRVPAPLALLFSMAEGTEKRLEAPLNNGWFVVQLEDIAVGQVAANDPLLVQSRRELGPTVGGEYSAQFAKAILNELKVERNQSAFDAVLAQLSGTNQQQ